MGGPGRLWLVGAAILVGGVAWGISYAMRHDGLEGLGGVVLAMVAAAVAAAVMGAACLWSARSGGRLHLGALLTTAVLALLVVAVGMRVTLEGGAPFGWLVLGAGAWALWGPVAAWRARRRR